jgi:hypothetical protein
MRDMPSFQRRSKVELVNHTIRLRRDQSQALEKLRSTLGIVPAEFIRDAVDIALRQIDKGGFR